MNLPEQEQNLCWLRIAQNPYPDCGSVTGRRIKSNFRFLLRGQLGRYEQRRQQTHP